MKQKQRRLHYVIIFNNLQHTGTNKDLNYEMNMDEQANANYRCFLLCKESYRCALRNKNELCFIYNSISCFWNRAGHMLCRFINLPNASKRKSL